MHHRGAQPCLSLNSEDLLGGGVGTHDSALPIFLVKVRDPVEGPPVYSCMEAELDFVGLHE